MVGAPGVAHGVAVGDDQPLVAELLPQESVLSLRVQARRHPWRTNVLSEGAALDATGCANIARDGPFTALYLFAATVDRQSRQQPQPKPTICCTHEHMICSGAAATQVAKAGKKVSTRSRLLTSALKLCRVNPSAPSKLYACAASAQLSAAR